MWPYIALAGLAWFMFGQRASAAAPSQPKVLASATAKKKPAGKIAVKIGPAVLTTKEAQSVPLVVHTPAESAVLIRNALIASHTPLPSTGHARSNAQPRADEVRTLGPKYNTDLMQAWQITAGLKTVDGSYNAETIAALKKYGAKNVSTKQYKRAATSPYLPTGA